MSEQADAPATASEKAEHSEHGIGHVVPIWLLGGVLLILLFFTWLTLATAGQPALAPFAIWIAMGIATVKASYVVLYFMHLRWDNPFNSVVFIGALIFVFLFIAFVLTDTVEYQPEINQPRGPTALPSQ